MAPAIALRADSGNPPPADVRARMEQAFGADFSAVRVHEDSDARAMGARAYAQGTNIHFAPGRYAPNSLAGQELLGHELAHVVQQAEGRGRATTQILGRPVNDDPALEREADEQMRTLSAEDRVRLIDAIAGGTVVGNEDEQTIVRLLATTPTAQAGRVRDRLGTERLQQLDGAIDFDDYRDYHTALRGLIFRSLSPEDAAEQMAGARVFPWADPGLIHALWNVRFHYDEVELHDDGKLHVSYWTNLAAFGMRTETVQLDPFEMIAVRFHYPEEYAGAQRDQTIYMPAINLRGLHRHQFRGELQTAVDVGLLAAGGAGLAGAGTRLARIVAALDLAVGAADLAIRDFRHEIARTEQGRDFLAAWDVVSTVIAAYGITRVVLEAPQVFRRLREAFQRLRGAGSEVSGSAMQRIESEVDEVLQQADEAGDAAAGAGRGDAAAGEPSSQGASAQVDDGPGGVGRQQDGEPVATSGATPRFSTEAADELIGVSEGRPGLLNSRGRQFPGHAGDHIPPEGADRAAAMAHAQRRPHKRNTTVYYSRRHAVQDLRDALNAHADEIASLAPGQPLNITHGTPLRIGFDSLNGAPPREISFDTVTIALERLMDGELHLVHFSPRIRR